MRNYQKLLMLALIVFCSGISLAALNDKLLYVAKNGNDAWFGSLAEPNSEGTDGPLATLEAARDNIRSLKADGKLPSSVTVYVREGIYYLNKTLVLGEQDSGTRDCPVTFTAFPGEKPIISGGKKITQPWKKYKGKIMVCIIPGVMNDDWLFHELFADGRRQVRAHTPDTGFFYMAELMPDKPTSFRFNKGEMKEWRNLNDVELLIYQSWSAPRIRLKAVDLKNQIATIDHAPHYPLDLFVEELGYRPNYIIENVFEGLDTPGEWYLDKHTGELFFWPPDGVDPNKAEMAAPVLNQLVLVQGDIDNKKPVSNIILSGFTFSGTDWPGEKRGTGMNGAVTLSYARNCTFQKNRVINVGAYGIEVIRGSRDNLIDGNEVLQTGYDGILVRGGRVRDAKGIDAGHYEHLAVTRNTISNNHVHHCGLVSPTACGIMLRSWGQDRIAHNHIHDTPYSGIILAGPGQIVEYNHIHHVMQKLSDGAGIYLNYEDTYGTLIRNNVIHDVISPIQKSWGIYLDNFAEHVTVMNNIVYRTLGGGSMIHGGRWNRWLNNIFVNGMVAQIRFNTYEDYSLNNIYERNIFYWDDPEIPLIKNLTEWLSFRSIEVSDYNTFYCTGGGPMKILNMKYARGRGSKIITDVKTYEEWRHMGFDFHSIVADPLFIDPGNDDYRLQENSPALKLGFRPIDTNTVGPQN